MSFVGVSGGDVLVHVRVTSPIQSCFKLLASSKWYRLISVKTLNISGVFGIHRNDYKEFQLKVCILLYNQSMILVNKHTQGTEENNKHSVLLQLKPNTFTCNISVNSA